MVFIDVKSFLAYVSAKSYPSYYIQYRQTLSRGLGQRLKEGRAQYCFYSKINSTDRNRKCLCLYVSDHGVN